MSPGVAHGARIPKGAVRRLAFSPKEAAVVCANTGELQRLYGGRCQVCALDPKALYGSPLCNGHHIEWLSRGSEDVLGNMALLCPTHHAAAHKPTTVFDFGRMEFRYPTGRIEPLVLNKHLPAA